MKKQTDPLKETFGIFLENYRAGKINEHEASKVLKALLAEEDGLKISGVSTKKRHPEKRTARKKKPKKFYPNFPKSPTENDLTRDEILALEITATCMSDKMKGNLQAAGIRYVFEMLSFPQIITPKRIIHITIEASDYLTRFKVDGLWGFDFQYKDSEEIVRQLMLYSVLNRISISADIQENPELIDQEKIYNNRPIGQIWQYIKYAQKRHFSEARVLNQSLTKKAKQEAVPNLRVGLNLNFLLDEKTLSTFSYNGYRI